MYTADIFETAMNSCGYKIDKIKYTNNSDKVRQLIGRVKIPKKVTVDGIRKTIFKRKCFRWDATGHCFSLQSNVRHRRYDLPLLTIVEFKKRQETKSNI